MVEHELGERAMQAGNSFSGALSVVSKEAPEPIGSEFRRMFDEINFGSQLLFKAGKEIFNSRFDHFERIRNPAFFCILNSAI